MTRERRLVSLRRRVPRNVQEHYRTLWGSLAESVFGTGGHAWRFVSPGDEELHLEFLEFEAGTDPRRHAVVRVLLERLEAEAGAAESEEWLEAR